MAWVLLLVLVIAALIFFMPRPSATPVAVADARPAGEIDAIDVYWRPGCTFCMRLGAGLRRAGIPTTRHNIWENPDDAARVRSVADGNETVPTVVIGPIALVNPSVRQVKDAVAEHAPHLL